MEALALTQKWGAWPLVLTADGPSVPLGVLSQVYDDLDASGRLAEVFYDGGIRDFREFVAFLTDPGRAPSLVVDHETMKPVLLAWLQDFRGGTATVHFCSLGPFSRGAARTLLALWDSWTTADGAPFIHVYLGTTPETHRNALRAIRTLGFTEVGTIPEACPLAWGKRVGGVISYRTNPRR